MPCQRAEHRRAPAGRDQAAHAFLSSLKLIAAISGKNLVRAIARQRNGDSLARQLTDAPGRQRRGIGKGFVEHPGDRARRGIIVRCNDADAVIGREPFGDFSGVAGFVMRRRVEADHAGLHWLGRGCRHHRDNARRIDAARQERAEWHIGDHARGDGGGEMFAHFLFERALRPRRSAGEIDVPPADRRGYRFAAGQGQVAPGRQL